MNSPAKVGAYLAGLPIVFAAATGLGCVVGPVGPAGDQPPSPAHTDVRHAGGGTAGS